MLKKRVWNRRSFLASTAWAAGAAMAASAYPARRKMTIDLMPGAIGVRVSPREAIDLAARHGFESVAPDAGAMARMSAGEVRDLTRYLQIGYDGPVRAEPFDDSLRELPADEAVARTAAAMRRAFALIDGVDSP